MTTTTTNDRDTFEREGLATLAEYPALLENASRLAERKARQYRREVGDIAADAVTAALSDLAVSVGRSGLPASEDDRAVWLAGTVVRAVQRERDRARTRWAPRRREEAPTEAPNRMERWADDAVLRHAERYTNGALSTVEQAHAVIDGRAESPSVAPPRRMSLTRQGGSTFVAGAPRTAYPSAEQEYLRGTWAALLRGVVDGSPTLLAAADAYREERRRVRRGDPTCPVGTVTRPRFIGWATAARVVGATDRGTFRRTTVAMLRRATTAARTWASIPRAYVGAPVPATVPAPTLPTTLVATLPPTLPVRPYGGVLLADGTTYRPTGALPLVARGDHARLGTTTVERDDPVPFPTVAADLSAWLAEREAAGHGAPVAAPTLPLPPTVAACQACRGASAHALSCPVLAESEREAVEAHRVARTVSAVGAMLSHSGPC